MSGAGISAPPFDTPVQIIGGHGDPLGDPVIFKRIGSSCTRIQYEHQGRTFQGAILIIHLAKKGFSLQEKGRNEISRLSCRPWTWKHAE